MMKQNRDSQSVVRAHLGVYELPLGGVRDKKKSVLQMWWLCVQAQSELMF